jgi:D-sedoheptulose 7-phosphate isomerase
MINNYIKNLTETLNKLNIKDIESVRDLFMEAKANGKQIFVFGNGGSGSTASHMVCDILKGCSYGKEKRFKIICLNDNIPTILAYANDVSYDEVFLEQLKNYLNEGDVVLGISGSGNSINVLKAIEYANKNNAKTIGFTGFTGGKLKEISHVSVNANINDMQISEDIHFIIMHILYKLFNSNN